MIQNNRKRVQSCNVTGMSASKANTVNLASDGILIKCKAHSTRMLIKQKPRLSKLTGEHLCGNNTVSLGLHKPRIFGSGTLQRLSHIESKSL